MPALNINTIKDAKLGSTELSAVYQGSTQIWHAPYPEPMSWLPINVVMRNDDGIWIDNQRKEDICLWAVHDDCRPYYMNETIELDYKLSNASGSTDMWLPQRGVVAEGPFAIVDGVKYMPVSFFSLEQWPVSFVEIFRIRQKKYDNTWGEYCICNAVYSDPDNIVMQPYPIDGAWFTTNKLPSPVHFTTTSIGKES